jgi:hypothetical protein
MTTRTTFRDYVAEFGLTVEDINALPQDAQERYRINGYNEWLKLKTQQPTPGNIQLQCHLVMLCIILKYSLLDAY